MRFLRDVAVAVAATLVVNASAIFFAGMAGLNPAAKWTTAVERYGLLNSVGTLVWLIGGVAFSSFLGWSGAENWWSLRKMKESDEKAIPLDEQMNRDAVERQHSTGSNWFDQPYKPFPMVYGVDFAERIRRDVFPPIGWAALVLACTVAAALGISYFLL